MADSHNERPIISSYGGLGRPLCFRGDNMVFPGISYVKGICRAMECKPRTLYLIDCPLCMDSPPGQVELDPESGTYWCSRCGREGSLKSLLEIAEGLFERRHRETVRLMTTRPRVELGGSV